MTVEDSQTDSDDDNDVVPKETIISRVVVDQVFDETKKLDKILKEKGSHYLETNIVVYPNFKWTDDVIFQIRFFSQQEIVIRLNLNLEKWLKRIT